MVELRVCIGSSCHVKGSYNVTHVFQQMIEEENLHDQVNFRANFCMKECHKQGVSVTVNDVKYTIVSESAREFFRQTILPLIGK